LLFTPQERRTVPEAQVVVHTPRTLADLLRRRVRAAEGVAQIERAPRALQSSARTRLPDLLIIAVSGPLQPLRVGFFLAVALFARLGSQRSMPRTTTRRGDDTRAAGTTSLPREPGVGLTCAPEPLPDRTII
jgi:hypothetical protein